jgi:ABC-type transport system involved in cytochrome c biogenesis permease component
MTALAALIVETSKSRPGRRRVDQVLFFLTVVVLMPFASGPIWPC